MLDLERQSDGSRFRRQVLQVTPNVWVVVDHTIAATGYATTVWNAAAGLSLATGAIPGSFRLSTAGGTASLTIFIVGSHNTTVTPARGSMAPFAGWQVWDQKPRPTPALIVRQSAADSWAVSVFVYSGREPAPVSVIGPPRMIRRHGDDEWELALPMTTGEVRLQRAADRLLARGMRVRTATKQLLRPEPVRNVEQDAYVALSAKYPRFQEAIPQRMRISVLLLIVGIGQEAFLAFFSRVRSYRVARLCSCVLWITGAVWVLAVFLK